MNTYVMSDIHGCYDKLMQMLEKIGFSEEDRLIIAGDYIDRGPQNREMLAWMMERPDNIILLRGNHEEEFAYSVDLLQVMMRKNELSSGRYEDTCLVYELLKKLCAQNSDKVQFFDHYGTIEQLIYEYKTTVQQLEEWSDFIRTLPFVFKERIAGKNCVVVHAGYIDSLSGVETDEQYESPEEFYLYARDDAYFAGGIKNGIVVAGHTPTIFPEELPYNEGKVYRMYDEEADCVFYNIDCGCAYGKHPKAKLACLRLEDEKVFYV